MRRKFCRTISKLVSAAIQHFCPDFLVRPFEFLFSLYLNIFALLEHFRSEILLGHSQKVRYAFQHSCLGNFQRTFRSLSETQVNNFASKNFQNILKTCRPQFSNIASITFQVISEIFFGSNSTFLPRRYSKTFRKFIFDAIQHFDTKKNTKTWLSFNSTSLTRSYSKTFPNFVVALFQIFCSEIIVRPVFICLSRNSIFCPENFLIYFQKLLLPKFNIFASKKLYVFFQKLSQPQFNLFASKLFEDFSEKCRRPISDFLPEAYSKTSTVFSLAAIQFFSPPNYIKIFSKIVLAAIQHFFHHFVLGHFQNLSAPIQQYCFEDFLRLF